MGYRRCLPFETPKFLVLPSPPWSFGVLDRRQEVNREKLEILRFTEIANSLGQIHNRPRHRR